jgi:hypothetical protein
LVPLFETAEKTFRLMSPDAVGKSAEKIGRFLQQSRRAVFELRKSDAFW